MEFQNDTPINRHLANIFGNAEAVVFCGAGVSLEPPAGLPDWHRLRDGTLEAIASKDEVLGKHLEKLTAIPMMAEPGKKGLTPELVASVIAGNCGGGYFECFRSLEDGEPNANHRYLAKMAKAGLLRHIVTTNFDLFIERGLEREGIAYRACRTDEDFRSFAEGRDADMVHVLKLHGCISVPETITVTVEQEGRGLSGAKADALKKLLPEYHFVFWGYSGADLKLDLDYLGMLATRDKARGFVWNFLPGEEVNPQVAKLAEAYGERASVVCGKLPEIFDYLVSPSDRVERKVLPAKVGRESKGEGRGDSRLILARDLAEGHTTISPNKYNDRSSPAR